MKDLILPIGMLTGGVVGSIALGAFALAGGIGAGIAGVIGATTEAAIVTT
jgi:hypothetical protein